VKKKRSMQVNSKYHISRDRIAEEQVLIEQARKTPERFEQLYVQYYENIFRFVYQRLDSKDQAFDITQQVFLKALTNLGKYTFRGVPFSSWLYRIASNEINDVFRRNKAQRTINIESVHIHAMLDEMEEDKHEEYYNRLISAIENLEEDDLMLIEMRYFEKRPFKEIAEIMSVTESNAKVKVYRIIEKLRKQILPNR